MAKQRRAFIGGIVGGNIIDFTGGKGRQKMVVAAKAYRPIGQAAQRVAIDGAADAGRLHQMPLQHLFNPIVRWNAVRRGYRHDRTVALAYSRRPQFIDEGVLWPRHQLNLRKIGADNFGASVAGIVHDNQFNACIDLPHQTAETIADAPNRIRACNNNRQRNRHGANVCRLTVSPRVADA